MLKITTEKKQNTEHHSISGLQALIISTATRVGMGNLVGVVAAISAGGAGAVFWMWVTALLGSSTAFAEATLAQIYKEKDPPVRRLPRRSCLLYSLLFFKKEQYAQTFCYRHPLCTLRPYLLVRHQSGNWKLGILSLS